MRRERIKRRINPWRCILFCVVFGLLVLCMLVVQWIQEIERIVEAGAVEEIPEVLSDTPVEEWMNELIYSRNANMPTEEKVDFINTHSELYYPELIELAGKNHEAVDFVYDYPFRTADDSDWNLEEEAAAGEVPCLFQWDERWGYHHYGSGMIGYTGCGPTCLAMVTLYLTGNPIYSPDYIAEFAEQAGYYVQGVGTSWELMSQGSQFLGINAEELSLSLDSIHQTLDQGRPIICAMGKGDFTDNGHFIVIVGYEEEGLRIHDPNSRERSEQLWDFEKIRYQIKNLWSYHAPPNGHGIS